MDSQSAPRALQARRWLLCGHVQGVGFRPFVLRLADRIGITGWVRNGSGVVEVLAQGNAEQLDAFGAELLENAPPLAKPILLRTEAECIAPRGGFDILHSQNSQESRVFVPPDYFTCEQCLAELTDPQDRRHRYPFINCTQCGPRYTLVVRLPYDRPNTTMARFPLCASCRAEYENPLDRRFHAQPLACPTCGPSLSLVRPGAEPVEETGHALTLVCSALQAGQIVAVKGIGGYHLVCDASNDRAIARLRERKRRPHKPLAVLFPMLGQDGLAAVRAEVNLSTEEARLLLGPTRPIVLARCARRRSLSGAVAPALEEVGVMLPYSPLHYLLVQDFGRPLVATSANVSGEPVLTENRDVEARLAHVADTFLHHDRPIQRPADDPVFRSIGERPRPIRLGRGCAPCELPSPVPLPHPVLAVGAHMKNTVALGWDERIVVSPHIGDMATARSRAVFEQVVEDLQSLYGVQARAVVCDAHRGYTSSRWAHSCGLPLTRVYHHHAHAAALVGEGRLDEDWLVFTWDGVGLGPDGTLWGGEALLGGPGRWERVGSLRPFRLPGGEKVAREPWRSAMGLCWEGGQSWEQCPQDPTLLHHAWQRGLNCPKTSAVGRLFDGAAALVGLLSHASFEGQGPMLLESAADEAGRSIELPVLRDDSGLWILDWQPLLENLMDRRRTLGARAATFHSSLAAALVQLALRIRASHGVDRVGLCGGVFQNRRLVRILVDSLQGRGFAVQIPEQLPVNDASISFGQVIEYAFAGADH